MSAVEDVACIADETLVVEAADTVGGRTRDAFTLPSAADFGYFEPFGAVAVVGVLARITPECVYLCEAVESYAFLVSAVLHVILRRCYLHLEVCDEFGNDF